MRRISAVARAENFNGTFSGISVNRYLSASAFLIHSTNDNEEPWVRGRRRKALGPLLLLIVAAVICAVLVYLWLAGY
jgi:hypothetical protein